MEVLRTIAISMVLLEHLNQNLIFWPSPFFAQLQLAGLWTGVDVFFAISGFVIARSLLPKLQKVREAKLFFRIAAEFWLRRIWRLWPSAWFWLGAPLLLCLCFNRSGIYGDFKTNLEMAIAGVMNLANFFFIYVFDNGLRCTAFIQWSLSLEEQFYLLLPITAFLLRRWLVFLLGAILLYAFFTTTRDTTLDLFDINLALMTRGGSIAAGVLLAIWSRHPSYNACAPTLLGRVRPIRITVFGGVIALLIALGSSQIHIVSYFLGPVALLTAVLVWIASYNAGYLWPPGFSRSVMETLAARSYSLYLVHIPVYFAMQEIWFRLHGLTSPTWRQTVIYLALTPVLLALVTELNHRLLERPTREYGRRMAERFATARTGLSAAF